MPTKLYILNKKETEITIPMISTLVPGFSQAFSQPNIHFTDIFLQ